ncbi:MAG: DUF2887 domain-containing protein [Nostoc sp.]
MYFVEVQFQRDNDIYWRIITETFLYINQRNFPVYKSI